MVYAKLSELSNYLDADVWEQVRIFLSRVSEDMPEGEYPFFGEKAFARVMSYQTEEPEQCKIEAHDRYIDIQSTITGAEGISVFDRERLAETGAYREDKDVVLFRAGEEGTLAHTVNLPGYFTMLFPGEAHRPKERVREIPEVKKFVVKVAVERR